MFSKKCGSQPSGMWGISLGQQLEQNYRYHREFRTATNLPDYETDGLSGYHLAGIQYPPHFRWEISRSKEACSESHGTFYSHAGSPYLASDPSKDPRFPENHKNRITVYFFSSHISARYRFDFHNYAYIVVHWNLWDH